MSQMPDKIWLHKDTKYNTGDIVCGYQYEFAEKIQDEGIENFIEYVPLNAFIEKAAEWLNNFYNENTHSYLIDEDIKKFINYMKGE